MMPAAAIAPVLILSTGRCGSTMVSDMLNRHPGVLSLSEFFIPLGPEAFAWQQPDGARMWKTFSRQSPALHAMIKDGIVVSENLYPFDQPGARFRADTGLPPHAFQIDLRIGRARRMLAAGEAPAAVASLS